jgi:predicted MFS family arabinose efflux permease
MRTPTRVHYGWIVAAVTCVVLLLTAGIRAAPGVLIVPLEDEFHWPRSTISFAIGVNLLLYGAHLMPGCVDHGLAEVTGTERTGIMVASITVIHQVGGALAAYVGGVRRISFGTYFEAFFLAGLLCFGAALMALLIGFDGRRAEPAQAAVPAE